MSQAQRRALPQFRAGVAPIALETGRYNGVPVEQRLCFHCREQNAPCVETEEHVILTCPLYDDLRENFLDKIVGFCPDFIDSPSAEKLKIILSKDNIAFLSAKFLQNVLCRRRKQICDIL